MKKMKLLSLTIVVLLTLTACGKDPFMADISYMPPELKQNNEKILQENLEKYKSADEIAKSQHAGEVGYSYMTLGNYRESIKYYEEVLASDPVNFPALNNIAFMYEEAGDFVKALEYEKKLYETNTTNSEVVGDTIRILVKGGHLEDAVGVLDKFSTYDKETGNNYAKFISDQYQSILDARAKKNNKQ